MLSEQRIDQSSSLAAGLAGRREYMLLLQQLLVIMLAEIAKQQGGSGDWSGSAIGIGCASEVRLPRLGQRADATRGW